MATAHGKRTVFKLDNAAGTLVDMSSYADSSELARSIENDEDTSYGSNVVTRVVGLGDSEFSAGGRFDGSTGAIDAHLSALYDALLAGTLPSATYEWGPDGSSAGKPKKSGETLLSDWTVTSPVDGKVDWECEFEGSGPVTNGVWP